MTRSLFTPSRWPYIAFAVSAALILGALAFEHIGGLAPCQMCYWQRYAHWAIMAISGAVILLQIMRSRPAPKIALALIVLAALISAGLGFWHMGVEYKWWEGPQSCMGVATGHVFDPGAFLDGLDDKQDIVSCGDVVWKMGLSMAGWNFVISAGVALLGLRALKFKGAANDA